MPREEGADVPVRPEAEQQQVEHGQPRRSAGQFRDGFQCTLVVLGCRGRRRHPAAAALAEALVDGVHLRRWDCHFGEPRLAGATVVGFRVAVRDAALVNPCHVPLVPLHARHAGHRPEHLHEGPTRDGDVESTTRCDGFGGGLLNDRRDAVRWAGADLNGGHLELLAALVEVPHGVLRHCRRHRVLRLRQEPRRCSIEHPRRPVVRVPHSRAGQIASRRDDALHDLRLALAQAHKHHFCCVVHGRQ
mmetsp:Transcript_26883/g.76047  ORF Transcript_26883/g.76047 Transcript_26883/m.76047 type:complete len:246 (+) Transcript_26883:344-1081(+)